MQQVLQGIRGICTLRTVHAAPNFCDLGSQFFNFAQNVRRIIYEEDYICSKLDDQLRIRRGNYIYLSLSFLRVLLVINKLWKDLNS